MLDIIDSLTTTYNVWCTKEGLPCVSADEQENVTEEQEAWLEAFITLWDLSQ